MQYRKLSGCDLRIGPITLGTWGFAGEMRWGRQDEDSAVRVIRSAVDLGINSIDTAELYGEGRSEETIGKAVEGVRHDVILATRFSPAHRTEEEIVASCERSLERLRTDYLDIYYIHWPRCDVPFSKTMAALELLKREGKIRFVGVSNFGKEDLPNVLEHGAVVLNQLPYSMLWRAIEYEVLPSCLDDGVDVAAYTPLLHGLLRPAGSSHPMTFLLGVHATGSSLGTGPGRDSASRALKGRCLKHCPRFVRNASPKAYLCRKLPSPGCFTRKASPPSLRERAPLIRFAATSRRRLLSCLRLCSSALMRSASRSRS